jgi:hypothetical protein
LKAEVLGEKKLGKKSLIVKDLMLGCYLALKRGSYYVITASSIYLEMRISHREFGKERGGVEIFLHTNLLSENIFSAESSCIPFLRTKEVGGYMRGVASTKNEKV